MFIFSKKLLYDISLVYFSFKNSITLIFFFFVSTHLFNSLVDEKSKNKRTQYLDKILKLNELNNTLDTSMKYVNKM